MRADTFLWFFSGFSIFLFQRRQKNLDDCACSGWYVKSQAKPFLVLFRISFVFQPSETNEILFKFIIFKEDEIKQSKIPCDQTVTFNWLFRRNWPFVVLCLAASDPWLPIRASNHFPWRTRLHRKKYSTTTTCKGKVRVDIINTRWKSVPNGYQNSEVCLCSISNWYQCVEVYSDYFSLKHNNNNNYYNNNNLYSAHILSSWRFTM